MADEELRLVATLDDRASEGLAKLQANVRQLGTGQNAQVMTQMQRQTGGVAEGLKSMTTGFSNAMTGMLGFTGVAAAIPVALAGMAVSFATSGVGAFAENLNKMAREADKTGTSLAQYKANIGVLKTAGITEQEATATIERFTRIQTELGQMGSKVRQSILAATPLWGQDEMNEWLNNVVTLPTEQAMEKVRERGKDIRRSVYDTAIAEGKTVAQANRLAADAENEWLQQWGATALANIRKPFREATQEEIALMESRRVATMAWTDATGDISSAWSDIKDSIASIAIGPLTVAAQGLAVVMRGVADAVRIVEGVIKSPPTDMLDMADRLQRSFPATANELRAIDAFLKDPGQGLLDMANRLKQEFLNLIPQAIYEFFENPSQNLLNYMTTLEEQGGALGNSIRFFREFFENPSNALWTEIDRIKNDIANLIPQPVKDFFNGTSEGLYNLIVRIDEAIKNWVVEPIKEFFERPAEGLRMMVNWLYERWNDLKTLSQPFIDFFSNPPDAMRQMFNDARAAAAELIPQSIMDFINEPSWGNFKQMISDATTAFANMIPEWVKNIILTPGDALTTLAKNAAAEMVNFIPGPLRRLLGLDGAPEAAPTGAELFGAAHGGGGIPISQVPGNAPLPTVLGGDLAAALGLGDIRGQHGAIVNQPTRAVIGEAGPEAVMPLSWLRSMMPSKEAMMAAIPGIATTALWGGEMAGLAPAGSYYAARRAQIGIEGIGQMPTSMRDIRNTVAQFVHPQIAGAKGAAGMLGSEAVQGALSSFLPQRLLDEITGFATAESREAFMAGRELDRSAAQQVNVSGVGRISVDVRAPEGTRVNAEGEGLFKTIEIARQTSMMPAEYGPLAATGVNAGTGSYS